MTSSLLAAISFLTSIPVARRRMFGPEDVARSARWFPLVGAFLGAITAGAALLLSKIFPPIICSIIAAGLLASLTGAMHLDGLADTVDGFGGGRTRADVLRIMRDHSIGSYAGVALILIIGLKVGSISSLIESGRTIPALVLAPALGRWSSVLLSATQPYARPKDDAITTAGGPARLVGRVELILATIIALIFSIALDPVRGSLACASVALSTMAWSWWCRARIGGITGDTLGASIEASECFTLLLFVGMR